MYALIHTVVLCAVGGFLLQIVWNFKLAASFQTGPMDYGTATMLCVLVFVLVFFCKFAEKIFKFCERSGK